MWQSDRVELHTLHYSKKLRRRFLFASSSRTFSGSIGRSRFMVIWARPLSRDSPIVLLRYDLSLLMVENDRSAVAEVSGNVRNGCKRMYICGYRNESHTCMVSAAVAGRSESATAVHFSFQRSNSPSITLYGPRSDRYKFRASVRSSNSLASTNRGSRLWMRRHIRPWGSKRSRNCVRMLSKYGM